jgi:pyruvate formate lyase activating enzyme
MHAHDTTGLIFDVQRFCTHDGPGIRTTVFLKGCPLRCAWCHNPESQRRYPELLYGRSLCIDCDSCAHVCPTGEGREKLLPGGDRDGCDDCLRCFEVCPSGAIELAGQERSVGEVLATVLKDSVFYEESGGGLTLSGGEPLAQFPFSHALLRAARAAGIHTTVETCGYGPMEFFEDVAPFVDLFLWDIKETDPDLHRQWTGVSNDRILANLHRVAALGRPIRLRCVLVAGVNDRRRHALAVARLADSLPTCRGIDVLPYHGCGGGKLESLGRSDAPQAFRAPDKERLEQFKNWLAVAGQDAA